MVESLEENRAFNDFLWEKAGIDPRQADVGNIKELHLNGRHLSEADVAALEANLHRFRTLERANISHVTIEDLKFDGAKWEAQTAAAQRLIGIFKNCPTLTTLEAGFTLGDTSDAAAAHNRALVTAIEREFADHKNLVDLPGAPDNYTKPAQGNRFDAQMLAERVKKTPSLVSTFYSDAELAERAPGILRFMQLPKKSGGGLETFSGLFIPIKTLLSQAEGRHRQAQLALAGDTDLPPELRGAFGVETAAASPAGDDARYVMNVGVTTQNLAGIGAGVPKATPAEGTEGWREEFASASNPGERPENPLVNIADTLGADKAVGSWELGLLRERSTRGPAEVE